MITADAIRAVSGSLLLPVNAARRLMQSISPALSTEGEKPATAEYARTNAIITALFSLREVLSLSAANTIRPETTTGAFRLSQAHVKVPAV